MKQAVTIIDVSPTYQGVRSIIAKVEMKRRGLRFLPRQVLKKVCRAAHKGRSANPFS
ncbi:hypothetical protein ACM7UU_24935 [Pseudomonas aeruginosa]